MRLCSVKDLRAGMKVARDVCDDRLELVAAAGLILGRSMIERLEILEVDDIYIEEPGTEEIQPSDMISDRTRRQTHKLLKRTFDELMNISEMREVASEDVTTLLQYDDRYANAVKLNSFREIIHGTIEDLFAYQVETFETPLVKYYLNRSYEHALNVTVLSLLIGRGFGFAQDELLALGTAAMLHDIGKLLHPELADRPLGDLTLEEAKRLRLHPDAGAVILAKAGPRTSLEQATIRQHHEQQDGRGYPARLTGSNTPPVKWRQQKPHEIFRFAEILHLANTFDNLINGDLPIGPLKPTAAMETLVRGAGSLYNHAVVSKALELINVYPVGSIIEVRLGTLAIPTGTRGVVRQSTGHNFQRPEILALWDRHGNRIPARVLDLNRFPGIEIDLV